MLLECCSHLHAGIALILRVAFVAVGVFAEALAFELVLDAGDGTEFSFSSASLADDSDGSRCSFSAVDADVDARSFEGSRIDADIRRCCATDALIVLGVARAEGPDGMRVGVADVVPAPRDGGGPIAPSTDRLAVCPAAGGPFARTLRPSVDFVRDEGTSLNRRSFAVLPESESTDGGREETVGVPKIEDSRRAAGTFAVEAGVEVVVLLRTLMRLFSCTE